MLMVHNYYMLAIKDNDNPKSYIGKWRNLGF